MTPETESRIRSLSANVLDLADRIKLLEARLRDGNLPLDESRQVNGDLHVAMRARFEAQKELDQLCWSHDEIGPPKA